MKKNNDFMPSLRGRRSPPAKLEQPQSRHYLKNSVLIEVFLLTLFINSHPYTPQAIYINLSNAFPDIFAVPDAVRLM